MRRSPPSHLVFLPSHIPTPARGAQKFFLPNPPPYLPTISRRSSSVPLPTVLTYLPAPQRQPTERARTSPATRPSQPDVNARSHKRTSSATSTYSVSSSSSSSSSSAVSSSSSSRSSHTRTHSRSTSTSAQQQYSRHARTPSLEEVLNIAAPGESFEEQENAYRPAQEGSKPPWIRSRGFDLAQLEDGWGEELRVPEGVVCR